MDFYSNYDKSLKITYFFGGILMKKNQSYKAGKSSGKGPRFSANKSSGKRSRFSANKSPVRVSRFSSDKGAFAKSSRFSSDKGAFAKSSRFSSDKGAFAKSSRFSSPKNSFSKVEKHSPTTSSPTTSSPATSSPATSASAPASSAHQPYQPPKGQKKQWKWKTDSGKVLDCSVEADWLVIRKKEKPIGDIFYTYYSLPSDGKTNRPLTFVFNGGPGASSAYLHIGVMGPKGVVFGPKGETLAPPAQLQDNKDTWLDFTDLVFIDPIGTGFSRSLEDIHLPTSSEEKKAQNKEKAEDSKEFYKMNRDLEVIGEFIQRFLSHSRRWSSRVFIAGESYGGFRVAKLSRKLQEDYGVGLSGVILISPCLELDTLSPSDYSVLQWVEMFPTMVATALYHKKSSFLKGKENKLQEEKVDLRSVLKPAENFAINELNRLLIQGEKMSKEERKNILQKTADFIGMSFEHLNKGGGRLRLHRFCRKILEKERKWCGIYDTSIVSEDPFPDRDIYEGPDATLGGVEPIFTHGINSLLREFLQIDCDRQYRLLNLEVNKSWKHDKQRHFFDLHIGAVDDLRYAMSLNPHMQVCVCHGVFDLVTPYFSSERIIHLMNLPEGHKKRIFFHLFHGGHMFYTWRHSRQKFKEIFLKFYS